MTTDVETPWRPESPLAGELTRIAAAACRLEGELTAIRDRVAERVIPYRREAVCEHFDEFTLRVTGTLDDFRKMIQLLPEHKDSLSED